jgi:integrative and conjugative element protein (TIGR02256 family)
MYRFKRNRKDKRIGRTDYHQVEVPTIEVKEDVIEALNKKSSNNIVEDCGVFVGSITNDGNIRVSKISPSCSLQSSATNRSCIRDIKPANQFIKNEFEESNHTRIYIGEWHTHPEDIPTPSFVDVRSIHDIFEKAKRKYLIVAIVGYNDIYWGCYDGKAMRKVEVVVI